MKIKTISLEGISNMDFPALQSIFEYWKEYDSKTVLFSYAELKRRGFTVSEKSIRKLNEFSKKHEYSNIDNYLKDFLNEQNLNSYEEHLESVVELPNKEKLKDQKVQKAPSKDLNAINKEVNNELLKELLSVQKQQIDKLERIRSNTSVLVWWLIVIPILLVLFSLFFGGFTALSLL